MNSLKTLTYLKYPKKENNCNKYQSTHNRKHNYSDKTAIQSTNNNACTTQRKHKEYATKGTSNKERSSKVRTRKVSNNREYINGNEEDDAVVENHSNNQTPQYPKKPRTIKLKYKVNRKEDDLVKNNNSNWTDEDRKGTLPSNRENVYPPGQYSKRTSDILERADKYLLSIGESTTSSSTRIESASDVLQRADKYLLSIGESISEPSTSVPSTRQPSTSGQSAREPATKQLLSNVISKGSTLFFNMKNRFGNFLSSSEPSTSEPSTSGPSTSGPSKSRKSPKQQAESVVARKQRELHPPRYRRRSTDHVTSGYLAPPRSSAPERDFTERPPVPGNRQRTNSLSNIYHVYTRPLPQVVDGAFPRSTRQECRFLRKCLEENEQKVQEASMKTPDPDSFKDEMNKHRFEFRRKPPRAIEMKLGVNCLGSIDEESDTYSKEYLPRFYENKKRP